MSPPVTHDSWERKDWIIEKLPKTLSQFNGRIGTYQTWYDSIRDHLISSNEGWGRLLDLVEHERPPRSMQRLRDMQTVDGCPMDMIFNATQLWSFMGNHCLHDAVFSRRLQLVKGESSNGLELWRKVFMENKGGAEHVVMAGLRRLHNFHACPTRQSSGMTSANG